MLIASTILPTGLAVPCWAQDEAPLEIVPQFSHSAPIRSVAYSSDGNLLLSLGRDNAIKLWDLKSGLLLRNFPTESSRFMALSPDGKYVASDGGGGKVIQLRETETGRLVRNIEAGPADLKSIAFSPDGRQIISGAEDKTVRIWAVATGKLLRKFTGHGDEVTSVAFSPQGDLVLSSNGTEIKIWNAQSGALFHSFEAARNTGFTNEVFSPDGQSIAAGVWDKKQFHLKVWHSKTGRLLRDFSTEGSSILPAPFSPDGKQIVLADKNNMIELRDFGTGQVIFRFSEPEATSVTFSPEGGELLIGLRNGALKLVNARTAALATEFKGGSGQILDAAYSPNGDTLLTGNLDGSVSVWSATNGDRIRNLVGHSDPVRIVEFSHDGRRILSGDGQTLRLWDAESGRFIRSFEHNMIKMDALPTPRDVVALSPKGERLLVGTSDKKLKLWDAETGRLITSIDGRFGNAAFSPDGSSILLTGPGGKIELWDPALGKPVRRLVTKSGRSPASVAFSPDGRLILASDFLAGTITVWDAQSGDAIRTMDTGRRFISTSSIAMSPDSKKLLVGGNELQLFDVETGALLHSFAGFGGGRSSVAFSSDGRRIMAAGSADKTMRLWDAASGTILLTLIGGRNPGDGLALTSAGFFTASGEGANLLAVVDAYKGMSTEQFYQALYRPDLVEDLLKGDPLGRYAKAAAKLNLRSLIDSGPPPRVIIKKTERSGENLLVTAAVEDSGGGVGKIEWRIDKRTQALANERGAVALTPDTDTTFTRSFTLRPGRNVISITAYNARNLVASLPNEITIDAAGISTDKRGTLYALVVGVDKYADKSLTLSNAAADARALGTALKAVGQNVYDDVKIVPVLNQDVVDDVLDRVFSELAATIRSEDKFVFFIAGHGLTVDGKYYFLPQDFEPANGDTYATKGINQDRWQEWFARIKARSSVLLYDTCEAGSVARNASSEKAAAMDRLTQAVGINVIAASDADQPAREGYNDHGLFTWALLDGLANGDENKDRFIEIFELANHVGAVVPTISKREFGFEQRPRARTLSNFPLGLQLADVAPGEIVPREPNRIITRAVSVELTKGGVGDRQQKAFTLVRLLKLEGARALIARDGQELGYVPADALAEFQ